MKRITSLLAIALLAVAAPNASAQQSTPAPRDTISARAATDSALRDLERAVSALATSVQELVVQTANKPEVRLAAVQVAGRAVSIAHQAVTENTSEIERLLAEASRLLAAAEAAQKAKVAKP